MISAQKFGKGKNTRLMKRILSLLFAVALLSCSLVSCDMVRGVGGDLPPVTQHVHIFDKATCQSPKTCECGATEGKPLNRHNFEGGVCVDCDKKLIVELARIGKGLRRGNGRRRRNRRGRGVRIAAVARESGRGEQQVPCGCVELAGFLEKYSELGGTHHSALVYGEGEDGVTIAEFG